MNPLRSFLLPVGLLAGLLCNSAMAAYLDFTDDSLSLSSITNGYSGSIDGVSFTLTTTHRKGDRFVRKRGQIYLSGDPWSKHLMLVTR